ncbi:hypothetical protein QCA50_003676 [Cerrena zonata]|uniref:BZIP domain-containing protein n=1 Tax=Cerrena zonata TaxID=2478898 RepID=A0AAW0GST2_9APHY
MDLSSAPMTPSTSSRKRSRENETPQQRQKREKAAERQRRKRERDRVASQQQQHQQHQHQQQQQQNHNTILQIQQGYPPPEAPVSAPPSLPPQPHTPQPQPQSAPPRNGKEGSLSPEEAARQERVRASARERQRKHRALVKQRKLRELGIDMGNDVTQHNVEDMQYHGQYQNVMAHEIPPPHMHPHPHGHPGHEPAFHQQPLGGQTFASTLLLSFSCAPLLKQHLLRNLNMTNEELASLEPIIAQAWDQWDQQRRMFGHHPHPNAPKPPDGSTDPASVAAAAAVAASYALQPDHAVPHPFVHDPNQAPNDFRSRFARSLVAPSPFRTGIVPDGSQPPPPASSPRRSLSALMGAPRERITLRLRL